MSKSLKNAAERRLKYTWSILNLGLRTSDFKLPIITLVWMLTFTDSEAQENQLPVPFINQAENGLIYNTVFAYKDFSFSGLMVLKKEEDAYHIVLLSKLGPSFMDFFLKNDELIWKKVPKELDKRVINKILKKDFNLILLKALQDPVKIKKIKDGFKVKGVNTIKVKLTGENKIREAESKRGLAFFKTKASFFYVNDDDIPNEICITHNYIKMKMDMNLLERK